jgi:hypothetical protein
MTRAAQFRQLPGHASHRARRRRNEDGAVVFLRDVGDKRENPRHAAALPSLFCDGFDFGALARRSRDDMDSSLRKS